MKHPPHFVAHENTGEDPKTSRPYAFAVHAVSPRNDLDHCDVQVTPEQFAVLRAFGAVYADATHPVDGWVRGEDFVWIDTGDLSPGGLDIDTDGSKPNADFVLIAADVVTAPVVGGSKGCGKDYCHVHVGSENTNCCPHDAPFDSPNKAHCTVEWANRNAFHRSQSRNSLGTM